MKDLSSLFKAYDVRGRYPDELDENVSRRIGAAFATFTQSPKVLVARDMRVSSEPLAAAFAEGVTSQGVDVWDLGLVSTDAMYFASGHFKLPGVMFTASHNPPQDNGMKFCLSLARPVGIQTGLADIRELAERPAVSGARAGSVHFRNDVVDLFVDHVLAFIDPSHLKPLVVAADAGNGMAGKMLPPVFERLPVKLIPLYFDLDGTFPNHPANPLVPENLRDLQDAVRKENADIGMAFDGDADRVFLVDEASAAISGSLTTALVASGVLRKEPGATIVHNRICSRIVPETVRALGGKPVVTRVGHSFVKAVMASESAAFGGEHSGHYYFRDHFFADSGLVAALLVLEAVSAAGGSVSSSLAPYRKYWNSGEINRKVHDTKAALDEVAAAHSQGAQDWIDGLSVEYPNWWFNLRPSNTEPFLRLNVEAVGQRLGEDNTQELLSLIEN